MRQQGAQKLTLYCGACVICMLLVYYLITSKNFIRCSLYEGNHLTLYPESINMDEVMRGPLSQSDPRIVSYILQNGYLIPAALMSEPYNLMDPSLDNPSMGQAQMVNRVLKELQNGFFVECGALDGETRSNTLFLERKLNWTGLLIEGDPSNYELLKNKKRKAWISKACLATEKYPHQVTFEQNFNRGKIINSAPEDSNQLHVHVQCFPLFSLLSALNQLTVDYFSLDVEGAELEVLKTIPFDKVFIKTLSVEYVHDVGGKDAIRNFMTNKSYTVFGEVTHPRNWANDLLFIHNSLRF